MLCFMCYEPVEDKAIKSLVGDVYVYICEECMHDLNLTKLEEEGEGECQENQSE